MDFNSNLVIAQRKGKQSKRPLQMGKEIKRIISELFQKSKVKDYVLFDRNILITHVDVNSDSSVATVYFYDFLSIGVETAEKQKELITAMKRCVPFFRKILSKELNIKVIPQLFFKIETQFDRIEEVEQWFKDI
jgi:ribosome-binding factor A